MSSLNEHSIRTVRRSLTQIFWIKDPRQLPTIESITISYSFINHKISNRPEISPDAVIKTLLMIELIGGQRPVIVKSNKDSAALKIRKGHLVAAKVNLNKEKSVFILESLVTLVLPNVPLFKGFESTSIDKSGNFSFRIENPLLFPEIGQRFEIFKDLRGGINFSIKTTGNKQESLALLTLYQIPFYT